MDQNRMFQIVSVDELRSVEGGGILSDIWGAIKSVGNHISVGFRDFAGNLAGILRFGFRW